MNKKLLVLIICIFYTTAHYISEEPQMILAGGRHVVDITPENNEENKALNSASMFVANNYKKQCNGAIGDFEINKLLGATS